MCTVTYLPLGKNTFILTSNRDENPQRKTIQPKQYFENETELLFPKDEVAGGTWIGTSNKNRLICLLNGGFVNHKRAENYKMSRGVIVKKLLTCNDAVKEITNFNFNEIEPFTIVLVDWHNQLKTYELVWTGTKKHFKELPQQPHIWSSSTLYTQQHKDLRNKWFANWLTTQSNFHFKEIVKFHQDPTKGNSEISLKMKRSNVETISTTCVVKTTEKITMHYFDYVTNLQTVFSLK